MIYEYMLKNGSKFIVNSPIPITDRQRRDIERVICESNSTSCLLNHAQEKEKENAPLD
jgi:hypothetical protein